MALRRQGGGVKGLAFVVALGISLPAWSQQVREMRPAPPKTKWAVSSPTNLVDGTKTMSLTGGRVHLRCGSDVSIYVIPPLPNLGHHLATNSSHQQYVRYRVDGGDIKSEYWSVSEDFEALFLSDIARDEILKGGHSMALEYQPRYTTEMTVDLRIDGLGAAYARACPVLPVGGNGDHGHIPPTGTSSSLGVAPSNSGHREDTESAGYVGAVSLGSAAAPPSGVFRVGGGVSAPSVLIKIDPEYSAEARIYKYSGTVLLSVVVGTDGHSREVRVLKSLGMGLDEKAVEAVQKWTFKPGMKGNFAVDVRLQVEVSFPPF